MLQLNKIQFGANMRGIVAKRLRKLAKMMAEYKIDENQVKDPDYTAKAEKRAYKLLKKEYNK